MTDGRPPREGADKPERDRDAPLPEGRRSQTRSVAGRNASDQPAGAPRATFSTSQPAPGPSKPAAGAPAQAPRSAFHHPPSAHTPTSSDPDKTVKRPYPTNPSTWGQTLPLGDLAPPLPPGPSQLFPDAESEKTVQVTRSAFVKTLLSGEALVAPGQPASGAQNAPATAGPSAPAASAGPAEDSDDAAGVPPEPLTMPSNRPAPAPWQQAHPVAPTGTILMPGATAPGGAQRAPAPAGAVNAPPSRPQSRPAPTATAAAASAPQHAPGAAQKTLPLGSAALTADAVAAARAPSAARKAAAEVPNAPTARRQPPAERGATAARAGTSPAAPAGAADAKNVSEPLQLRIEAHDVLHKPMLSERPVLPRNRGPLVAAMLIAALLVLAGLGWFGLRSTPDVAPEPTRNDAVTVPAGPPPSAAQPAQDPAFGQQPAGAQQPATTTQQPGPAQPTAAQPAAARSADAPQAREPKPEPRKTEPKKQTAAQKRRAERRAAAKRAAERDSVPAVPAPAGDAPEGVDEARDALRELESEPVMKIKPADEPEGPPEPDFPDLPEPPPEPPPAPPE